MYLKAEKIRVKLKQMGYTEIKENLKELSERERRKLVAYIVHLEELKEESYIERITQKIDDRKNFVRWNDVKNEFKEN